MELDQANQNGPVAKGFLSDIDKRANRLQARMNHTGWFADGFVWTDYHALMAKPEPLEIHFETGELSPDVIHILMGKSPHN